jgi:hypothetical protein
MPWSLSNASQKGFGKYGDATNENNSATHMREITSKRVFLVGSLSRHEFGETKAANSIIKSVL